MHKEYGKRALFETLHAFGFCISYDELRRFLTSAALHQLVGPTDVYVPPELVCHDAGGKLIHEGDDNIDINVETVDAKNTYHSMARGVFQQQHGTIVQNSQRIKRTTDKALVLTEEAEGQTKPFPFQKPTRRPEPARRDNAMEQLRTCCTSVSIDNQYIFYIDIAHDKAQTSVSGEYLVNL